MEIKDCKLPLVKLLYSIINFLQCYTTSTGYLRKRGIITPKRKWAITLINFIWLTFALVLSFFQVANRTLGWFLLACSIFRLWEILIINVWLFVFKQSAMKPNKTANDQENDIRLFILLIIQYASVVFLYSFVYSFMCSIAPNSFFIAEDLASSSPTAITWLYHSLGIISNESYGFIQPITDFARIVTISEIVFGLIFVLLFISNILSKFRFNWSDAAK